VHGEHLALSAERIIHKESPNDDDIEIIRDDDKPGHTHYNRAADGAPRINWYSCAWSEEQSVSTITCSPGLPEELGGWFTSLEIQFRDSDGQWQALEELAIEPLMKFDNTHWLRSSYVDHSRTFNPVKTTALRLIGNVGIIEQDERNGGELRFYTTIGELAVYVD
jgi:hypothetical protein